MRRIPTSFALLPTTLVFVFLALAASFATAGSAHKRLGRGGPKAPAPGRLDTRFGHDGIVARDFGTERTHGEALAAMPGPDGSILVLQPGRSEVGAAVARYLPDGRLDRGFGEDGVALDPGVEIFRRGDIAPGPGGTILVLTGGAISRFTSRGQIDKRYGHGGHVRLAPSPRYESLGFTAAVAFPDGSTVVIGRYPTSRSPGVAAVRYGPSGRRDPAYGPGRDEAGAFRVLREPFVAVASPDGGLVLATSGPAYETATLLRVGPDGHLDSGFGVDGKAVVDRVQGPPVGIVEEADGEIVVAFEGDELARVSASGAINPGAGTKATFYGRTPRMQLQKLVPRPAGGVIGVGYALTGRGVYSPSDLAVEVFDADGRPDASFGHGTGYVTTSRDPTLLNRALDVAILPDGRLVLSGSSGPSDGSSVFEVTLAALGPDGDLDEGFGEAGFVVSKAVSPSQDAVTDLLVAPDGGVLVAGHADGAVAVARYSAAGRLDRSFGEDGTRLLPSVGGWVLREGASLAAAADGGILVGPGSSGPPGVLGLDPRGDLAHGFGHDGRAGAGVIGEVLALDVRGDGGVVAFGVAPGGGDRVVTLMDSRGRVDKGFGRGGTALASRGGEAGYQGPLALGPRGVLAVLGGLGGNPLELNVDGSPTVPTDAHLRSRRTELKLPGEIVDLAFSGRRLIAFGQRAGRLTVTRLLADGDPDPSFGNGGVRTLRLGRLFVPGALAVEPDGHVLLSGVSHTRSSLSLERIPGRAVVVRLDPDGSLDPGFAQGGVFRSPLPTTVRVTSLALGRHTVTVGGASFVPGSLDLQMQLFRLGR